MKDIVKHVEDIDKKRLIAIQESLAAETESELQKYKEAIKRIQKTEDHESPLFPKRKSVIVQIEAGRVEPEKLSDKKDRKREDERLVKSHFSGGYACIGLGCEEQFENKTQLKKHMFTNHKCEHCNITCDNATNLNIHIEKDTFVHCLEFYLKKRQKREDERKENMKDNV